MSISLIGHIALASRGAHCDFIETKLGQIFVSAKSQWLWPPTTPKTI